MQSSHLCSDCQTTLIGAPKRDASGRLIFDADERDRARGEEDKHSDLWYEVDAVLRAFNTAIAIVYTKDRSYLRQVLHALATELHKLQPKIGMYMRDLSPESIDTMVRQVRDALEDLRDSTDMIERLGGTRGQQVGRDALRKTIDVVREAVNALADAEFRPLVMSKLNALMPAAGTAETSFLAELPADARELLAMRLVNKEDAPTMFADYLELYQAAIKDNTSVDGIPDVFFQMTDELTLTLDRNTSAEVLASLKKFSNLTSLELIFGDVLPPSSTPLFNAIVDAIAKTESLKKLGLSGTLAADASIVTNIHQLEALSINVFPTQLTNGSFFEAVGAGLPNLKRLGVYTWDEITIDASLLSPLKNNKQMYFLDLRKIIVVGTFPLNQVERLYVKIGESADLSTMTKLKTMTLEMTDSSFPNGMGSLSALAELVVKKPSKWFFDWDSIAYMPNLVLFSVDTLPVLDFDGWRRLSSLETLMMTVGGDMNLPRTWSPLANLKTLVIHGKRGGETFQSMQNLLLLSSLEHLEITNASFDIGHPVFPVLCAKGLRSLKLITNFVLSVREYISALLYAPELVNLSLSIKLVEDYPIDLSGAPKLERLELNVRNVQRDLQFLSLPPTGKPLRVVLPERMKSLNLAPQAGVIYDFTL